MPMLAKPFRQVPTASCTCAEPSSVPLRPRVRSADPLPGRCCTNANLLALVLLPRACSLHSSRMWPNRWVQDRDSRVRRFSGSLEPRAETVALLGEFAWQAIQQRGQ
jgi:hypothetical protein